MYGVSIFGNTIFGLSSSGVFKGQVWIDMCPSVDSWTDAKVSTTIQKRCTNGS